MRQFVAAFALLFALLLPPAGAQSKTKSKTSTTKATEESAGTDEDSEKKDSASPKKKKSETTPSKKTESDETATAKKASTTASDKTGAGTKTSAVSGTKSSASKPATDETKETEGKSGGAGAKKKTAGTGAKKTSGSGAKKSATDEKSDEPVADEEEVSQTPKTSKSKTTTKSGTKAGSTSDTLPVQDKSEKSTSGKGTSASSKPASANGTRKTSKTVDKPPQDSAGEEPTRKSPVTGPNITLDPTDLANFDSNSKAVQRLLTLSLSLTRQGLTYRYGSSDPTSGGMDCSGTIYYLLKQAGVKEPPRDSSGLYLWVEKEATLHRVNPTSLDDPAFADLRPGDLMFWEGTYEVQRDPPISHTMIYLGKEKATGLPVMVGASDGRTYGGVRRNGVSVFDFRLPRADSAAKFVAFGRVPGIDSLGNGKAK